MKRHWLQLVFTIGLLNSGSAWAETNDIPTNAIAPVKLSYIVTLRRETDQDGCARTFSVQRHHIFRHALNGFAANLDAATVERLRHDPRVLAVEPDGEFVLCSQTVPTGIVRMGITNFPVAHINSMDNRINVDVAVLDTGIQTNHPDLNVVQWVDCTAAGLNGNDWQGHGTAVAGVAGALDNNFGVVGVAAGVRLWSVQVITPGHNANSDFLAGLDYIAQHTDQIEVVNASIIGMPGTQSAYNAVHQAVLTIVNQGTVFVAAAGNSNTDITGDLIYGNGSDFVPAALPEVMAVSAMNPTNDTRWDGSNYSFVQHDPSYVNSPGFGIDVAAPGVNILSTYTNSGYASGLTGTSLASPHVAGLVALYIAANGRATNAAGVYKIRQAIVDNSLPQSQWLPNGNLFDANNNPTGDPDGNPEPLAMPSENWVPPPNIMSESMTAQGFQINFMTVPGYNYMVQYRNSLSLSNQWTNLTATNGAGSLTTVTVADPTPSATRFYRLARTATP